MTLWQTRSEALGHPELADLHSVLENGLDLVDQGLRLLERHFIDSDLARIGGIFLLKGRNLAFGCYSLTLDGLAQESGALLRPLVEVIEMSKYLRTVPDGIQRAEEARLPSAGKIAGKVGSPFENLRKQLNESASHIGLDYQAIRHLLQFGEQGPSFKVNQPFILSTARHNLILLGFLVKGLLDEVMLTIESVYDGCHDDLISGAEAFRQRLIIYHEKYPIESA